MNILLDHNRTPFSAVIVAFLFFSGVYSNLQASAEILRVGEGEIGMKGLVSTQQWPEGYSLPLASGKYNIVRLAQDDYPQPSSEALASWSPKYFTSLKGKPAGTPLEKFTFIVHGLEIETLMDSRGTDHQGHPVAFDWFVHDKLNPASPEGIEFIKFYPYFFHKKTIVSASVISDTLTATYGNVGFILGAPPENLIVCGPQDIYSPVDSYFYTMGPLHATCPYTSYGETLMHLSTDRHSLMPLYELMPPQKIIPTGVSRPFVPPKERDPVKSFIDQRRLSGDPENKIQALERGIQAEDPTIMALIEMNKNTGIYMDVMGGTQSGSFVLKESSWYNEVSINPARAREGVTTLTTLRGIFLRTGRDQLEVFKQRPEVQALWNVADAFDLPIVFVDDGNTYKTAL